MKQALNLVDICRTAIILLIGFILIYSIYQTERFGVNHLAGQASNIEEIIDKALVQCYALEGSYPLNIEYVQKYGVIFDNNKYIYHYEWYGGNLKPTIIVIEK